MKKDYKDYSYTPIDYKTAYENVIIAFENLTKAFNELQKENEKLKKLCEEYEEEHNTTFQIWKHYIEELEK